jgi:hypothetical protein
MHSNHFFHLSVLISTLLHLRGQAQIALRSCPTAFYALFVLFKKTDQILDLRLPLVELAQEAP